MSLETVWKHALNQDTGQLVVALDALADEPLECVLDAAQLIDHWGQYVLEAAEAEPRTVPE